MSSKYRDETKSNGFTVVMDSQKSSWRVTRTYLRYTATCLGVHLQDLLVIRPDTFKVVDNCVKTHKKGEVRQLHLIIITRNYMVQMNTCFADKSLYYIFLFVWYQSNLQFAHRAMT